VKNARKIRDDRHLMKQMMYVFRGCASPFHSGVYAKLFDLNGKN